MNIKITSLAISAALLSNYAFAEVIEIHRTIGPRNIVIVKNTAHPNEVMVTRDEAIVVPPKEIKYKWKTMYEGDALPAKAVMGGAETNPAQTFFIYRAEYKNGTHPGRWVQGRCHISWGGTEVSISDYEILVGQPRGKWLPNPGYGFTPANAFVGGYETGRPLYICQTTYENGVYPGKVVDGKCNFAWNGSEISTDAYRVLVK